MCRPASMILTKNSVFWSKLGDSHEEIIKEYGLNEHGAKGANILRVEICPPFKFFDAPIEQWNFHYDQDILPEWADTGRDIKRTRQALAKWIDHKVITDARTITGHGTYYATGDAVVYAYGNVQVYAYGDAVVYANGNVQVYAQRRSNVFAYGCARVHAYDYSTVEAHSQSCVEAYGDSWVSICHDHATVRKYRSGVEVAKPTGSHAVVVDCTGRTAVCLTAEGVQ